VRTVGALLVLAAGGFAAATAVADTPPLPPAPTLSSPVPLPTTTLPTTLPTISSPLPTTTTTASTAPPKTATAAASKTTTATATTSPPPTSAPSSGSTTRSQGVAGTTTAASSQPKVAQPGPSKTGSATTGTRQRRVGGSRASAPAAAPPRQANAQTGGIAAAPTTNAPSGVLGTTAAKAREAVRRPYLIVLLGLAIVLLGVAALPDLVVPDARLNYLLSRHRLELAVLGTAVLVGVAISLLR
jgi:hypothetical protein